MEKAEHQASNITFEEQEEVLKDEEFKLKTYVATKSWLRSGKKTPRWFVKRALNLR